METTTAKKYNTELEKVTDQLKAIRASMNENANVYTTDIKDCASKLDITDRTVTSYLNGIVRNVQMGFRIYSFFSKLIEKRVENLNSATA